MINCAELRLLGFALAALLLEPGLARADRLFTGDDWGTNLYEFDTVAGESSKVVFCNQVQGVNGLGRDGKGNLFVSDFGARSILKFTLDGKHTTFATLDSPGAAMAFDGEGSLYLPYQGLWGGDGRIDKFSRDGSTHSVLASNVPQPVQVVLDRQGTLFVSDQKSGCIYEFDPHDGTRTTFATGLKSPIGMVFDSRGILFVADAPGRAIYQYTTNGVRTTFAGRLKTWPCSLAFDSEGNLFEADGSGSVFEFENDAGELSRQPTLFASELGHNFFMTILPDGKSARKTNPGPAKRREKPADPDLVADKVLNATNLPGEIELKRQLVGTWRMAANESWGATQYRYYPAANGYFKTFTLTNWNIVKSDAQSNVLYSAGGAYSLQGNVYIESIDSATGLMNQFLGNHPRFKILVDGDKYYQLGFDGNPPNIKEMWQRVSP